MQCSRVEFTSKLVEQMELRLRGATEGKGEFE